MSRMIHSQSRLGASQAAACVGSLFALELLRPAKTMYLNTAMPGNAPILWNDLGQFTALFPDLEISRLTLATALSLLAERGTTVHFIYTVEHGVQDGFLALLSPRVLCRRASFVRHHGLFTEHFCLYGSLSFADFGVDIMSDRIELSTDPDEVNRALFAARQYWEDLG
ncbi:MAG: hypothetical protein WAW26_27920 [Anaerolineae bacterium]